MNHNQNLIDEQLALRALSGDRKLLRELATMFVEDAPLLLEDLEQAIDRRDLATAQRAIHSLRGLSLTFYANEVINLAVRLEEDLKCEKVDSPQCEGIQGLKSSVASLIEELRNVGYTQ